MDLTQPNSRDQWGDTQPQPRHQQHASAPTPGNTQSSTHVIPHWSHQRVLIGLGLWLLGALVLAVLSVLAVHNPEFPGDVGITEAVQQIQAGPVKTFINFASDANWPRPAGIIAIAIIVLLAVFRHFRAAICAAISGFGADLANVTLNGIVARPRPHNVHIHAVANLGLHSYPSGHVTHVIGFYGFLLYLSIHALRQRPSWWWLRGVQAICVYFIVFIGISRVLEGEHYPSDVVASYLLGSLVLVVAITLYHALGIAWEHIQRRRAGEQSRYALSELG